MAKELATQDDFDVGFDISDMMPIFMMIIMVSVLTSVIAPVAQLSQQLQAQAYTGLTDSRTLTVRPQMQWLNLISDPPYTPWVSAYFFNDGPNSAFIAVNNPDELSEVASGEDISINMTGAERRIELVFYKASAGERASVRVTSKY